MDFFDLHCDTATKIYDNNTDFDNKSLSVNSSCAGLFDKWFQCFAVFIPENISEPFFYYENVIKRIKDVLAKADIKNLLPIYTVEGGSLLDRDLSRIDKLKSDNIKALTLTWNNENNIAGGAYSDADLKPFGIEVIKKLNKNKIATDLSHLNTKSFYSAIEYANYPIATHSCLFEINKHKRNITCEMIDLIAQKNGVVGICLYDAFLGNNPLEKIYKNIYLCLEKGFEDNIAIGTDFDGCDTIFNTKDIPYLYDFFTCKGIKKKTLDKLFFENANRFFKSFDK